MLKYESEIESRSDLINNLVSKLEYKSYLEIGTRFGDNFDRIKCPYKLGIDPDQNAKADIYKESDTFFESNTKEFDIVFIDGLHHHAQTYRDICNAMKIIKPGGTIVVHDCNPTTEEMQVVPRMQQCWTGDVWKAFSRFRSHTRVSSYVVDIDFGCGIIEVNMPTTGQFQFPDTPSYKDLETNRAKWLGLVSVEEFVDRTNDRIDWLA